MSKLYPTYQVGGGFSVQEDIVPEYMQKPKEATYLPRPPKPVVPKEEYKAVMDSPSSYMTMAQDPRYAEMMGKSVQEAEEVLNNPQTKVGSPNFIADYKKDLLQKDLEVRNQYYKKYTPENKEEVITIQKMLSDEGYDLGEYGPKKDGVDGYFGDKTRAAYESYMQKKYNASPPPDLSKEAGRSRCSTDQCATYVSQVTDSKVLGDAWEMKHNIEAQGGVIKYNIYNDPAFKNINSVGELKSATQAVKRKSQASKEMFKVGDTVGLYYPSSSHHQEALSDGLGGTYNTHVGIVTSIKNGVPIISHNIYGKLHHDPYNAVHIGWIGTPAYGNQIAYNDEAKPQSTDPVDNINFYSSDLVSTLKSDIPVEQIRKDVYGILSLESALGELSPTKMDKFKSQTVKQVLLKPDEMEYISQGPGKIKLATFTQEERNFLGLTVDNLDDMDVAVKATTYLYMKHYSYYKKYAEANPQLKLTDDDIRSMAIISHNQGTRLLSNFGYNTNNLTIEEELQKLRELSGEKINDISSTKYQYLPAIVGSALYKRKYPGGHEPYVTRVIKHGETVTQPTQQVQQVMKGGGVITSKYGQWKYPGQVTKIPSNEITMEGVPYPVMGVSNTGQKQMMYPGKDYQFSGNSVTEYPMMQQGGLYSKDKGAYADSVLNANKELDWVKRLYGPTTKKSQIKTPKTIPGYKGMTSTHLMSDNNQGYVYPAVVNINGKLTYLGNSAEDYARETGTGVQLPVKEGTWFARNGYKQGAGVLKYQDGGQYPPITTNDPNDPRLKAWKANQDSLYAYNMQNKFNKDFLSNYKLDPEQDIPSDFDWKEFKDQVLSIDPVQTAKDAYKALLSPSKSVKRLTEVYPQGTYVDGEKRDYGDYYEHYEDRGGELYYRPGKYVPNNVANRADIINSRDAVNNPHGTRNVTSENKDYSTRYYYSEPTKKSGTISTRLFGDPTKNMIMRAFSYPHNIVNNPDIAPVGNFDVNVDLPIPVNSYSHVNRDIKSNSYNDYQFANARLPYYKKPVDMTPVSYKGENKSQSTPFDPRMQKVPTTPINPLERSIAPAQAKKLPVKPTTNLGNIDKATLNVYGRPITFPDRDEMMKAKAHYEGLGFNFSGKDNVYTATRHKEPSGGWKDGSLIIKGEAQPLSFMRDGGQINYNAMKKKKR